MDNWPINMDKETTARSKPTLRLRPVLREITPHFRFETRKSTYSKK